MGVGRQGRATEHIVLYMLPFYLSHCPNPLTFEKVSKAVCYASVCIGSADGMNPLSPVRIGLIVLDFLLPNTEQFINTTVQFNLDVFTFATHSRPP